MSRSERPRRHWRVATLAAGMIALANPVSGAEVLVVTAMNGPIATLNSDEASQLYLGRRTTLGDGTPVTLFDLPAGQTRDRFYALLTGKNPNQIRAYWSRQVFTGRALPPREIKSATDLPALLSSDPASIGYLPDGPVDPKLRILLKLP